MDITNTANSQDNLPSIIMQKKSVLESRLKLNGIDRSFEDYANDIIYAVSKSTELSKCKPATIVDSAFQLAKYGLSIGGNISHLVPFGNSCTFQIGYEGYALLLNKYIGIRCQLYETVHSDDVFEYKADTIKTDEEGFLKSKAKISSFSKGAKRDTIKGAFAYLLLSNGNSHILYMNKSEIDIYKPSKISGSFWGKWDNLMYSKQVFKILARKLLKSYAHTKPEIMEVIGEDENQNMKDINQSQVDTVNTDNKVFTPTSVFQNIHTNAQDIEEDAQPIAQSAN